MKQLYSFILIALCATSCLEIDYMIPRTIYYDIEEYDVSIKRTTTNRRSVYRITRGGKSLGKFYWDNSIHDEYGLITDSGTRYAIVVTRDTVYLHGESWKKFFNEPADRSVVVTWAGKPNAYYYLFEFNTRATGHEHYSYTDYYWDILNETGTLKRSKLTLMMYPELEHEAEFSPGVQRSKPFEQ